MAQSHTSTPSRPRRAPQVRYHNDDSDSGDFAETSESPPLSRPSRAVRRVKTYRESSDEDSPQPSSDESDSRSSGSNSHEIQLRRSARSRTTLQQRESAKKRKPLHVANTVGASPFRSYKRQKMQSSDHLIKQHSNISVEIPLMPLNERAPPWQQLPYHVLVSIMKYAAYPLYSPASRANPSINWLCTTSTLCHSFHEACIAALLYSPPLYPSWRAHGLIRLLKQDPKNLTTDYRMKIHYLDVEVKHLLVKKSGIPIDNLISRTPLLQGARLYSNYDDLNTLVWAQPTAHRFNWSYPPELFDRLDKDGLFMRSFEFNGRFPNTIEALQTALYARSRPSFSRLCIVSFLNMSLAERTSQGDIERAQRLLASALNDLPDLKDLTFRNCSVIDEVTVPMLPAGLQQLELAHCSRLTSDALEQYLASRGTTMTSLRLDGNQSMSLGFMARLKSLCPRLQNIEVDMLYIDPTSFRDRDPLYDELLPNGPPSWPTDLVNVSFENLRQLSASDAEDFFASLVDSSENLPRLKKLNIKAILKGASWRERAQLRKTWLPKLENVFLNTDEPANVVSRLSKKPSSASQRQSTRIANSHLKKLSLGDYIEDSDAITPRALQARCDIVNLVISDQRPSQEQFHENDFLDEEPSDDGEWRERNSQQVSNDYAW